MNHHHQQQHQHWLDDLARYLASQIPGCMPSSASPSTQSSPAPHLSHEPPREGLLRRPCGGEGGSDSRSSELEPGEVEQPAVQRFNARGPGAGNSLAEPPAGLVEGLYARQLALNPAAATWLASRRSAGAHGPVRSLAELPAIPVAAFKTFELTTVPAADRVAVFHSSGTTAQQSSRHFHSRETLAIYRLALEAWFKRRMLGDFPWAWQPRDPEPNERPRLISLTPNPETAPHSSLVYMIGALMDRFGAADSAFHGFALGTGWEIDFNAMLEALKTAADAGGPVIVFGTAFNFVQLLDELDRVGQGFMLPPGSRVMETGGYKGRTRTVPKTELRERIASRLGVSPGLIVGEYGMSELSSQAYDADVSKADAGSGGHAPSAAGRRLQFPPWCHVTVISPETGREVPLGTPGLVRIADLANVASVLAIQTEDLGVRHADGLELLGRATAAEPRGCSLLPVSAIAD